MNNQIPEGLEPYKPKIDDGCNVSYEMILDQVLSNIKRQLPQAQPHSPNNETVALVCGGPSLAKTENELVEAVWKGAKVVAVNGAYQWCIDRNIKPTAMVMLDARAFNARFVRTPVTGCKYFLASQCHPDAFEICKDRDTYIWHVCSGGVSEHELLKEYYFDRCFPIGDGTTVAIKAIPLMRMLGFQTFEIFGFDSCWMYDEHHSYYQPENDNDHCFPVWITPEGHPELVQQFFCAPWMMRQGMDFQKLIHDHGDKFRLNIHGDGLIAATMRLSAQLGSVTVDLTNPKEK
jgi:6-hydroxymethylpterin diphosphokinase MptE-like protein